MTIYYFVYKTTNIKTGQFYIGKHKTSNLEDGYLGSGTRIRRAIAKHGKDNFYREILSFHSDETSAAQEELKIVDQSLLKDPQCYNLMPGGHGGFTFINSNGKNRRNSESARSVALANKNFRRKTPQSEEEILRFKLMIRNPERNASISKALKGRPKSDAHKRAISESLQKLERPKITKCFRKEIGWIWITNESEDKMIAPNSTMPTGWRKGRKFVSRKKS